jgi:3-isopropylmalate dehydratase, small subunit
MRRARAADFPLNRPAWRGARIIVGGRNFGCGSSREGAVYALYDYGIRCVIAPSFGDIFSGNAVQNGLLTALVPDEHAAEIMATLAHTPELAVTVDLEQQTILCGNSSYRFAIDPVSRTRLLEGLDDIALTRAIATESRRSKRAIKAAAPGPRPSSGLRQRKLPGSGMIILRMAVLPARMEASASFKAPSNSSGFSTRFAYPPTMAAASS